MIIKTRQPSSSLLQLHHLKGRSSLDLSDYELELKGYYGEQLLDRIVSRVDFGNALVIQDLRLLDGKTERQFDTIVIVNQSAYILDAKYYTRDSRYQDGKFYHGYKEIENPDLQISRSETFLRNYIWKHFSVNFTVVGFFVFVNNDVTFRNDSRHPRLLHANELQSSFHELKMHPVMEVDYDIAESLVKAHRLESIHSVELDISEAVFFKGLKCPKCAVVQDVEFSNLIKMPCCYEIYSFNDVMYYALKEYCAIHKVSSVKVGKFTKFITGSDRRNYKIERFIRKNLKRTDKEGTYQI